MNSGRRFRLEALRLDVSVTVCLSNYLSVYLFVCLSICLNTLILIWLIVSFSIPGFTPHSLNRFWLTAINYNSQFKQWIWDGSRTPVSYDNYFQNLKVPSDSGQQRVCNEFRVDWYGHWNYRHCSDTEELPVVCMYTLTKVTI